MYCLVNKFIINRIIDILRLYRLSYCLVNKRNVYFIILFISQYLIKIVVLKSNMAVRPKVMLFFSALIRANFRNSCILKLALKSQPLRIS